MSASHQFKLDYPSKYQNLHGHNWIITVHARSEELDHNGMVIDFTIIERKIHGRLDHRHINDVLGDINPTCGEYGKMDR